MDNVEAKMYIWVYAYFPKFLDPSIAYILYGQPIGPMSFIVPFIKLPDHATRI
jgi:hypothetical protein